MAMEFKVSEASIDDVGKGWARLDADDLKALGVVLGDLIEVTGKKQTVCRVTGTLGNGHEKHIIQIDSLIRSNAQINVGEKVTVKKVPRSTVNTVVLYALEANCPLPHEAELEHFGKILQGYPVFLGDKINVPLFGGRDRFFRIEGMSPSGPAFINQNTKFVLQAPDYTATGAPASGHRYNRHGCPHPCH